MMTHRDKDSSYKELESALENQQTISIPKLKRLLEGAEMDINAIKSARNLRKQNRKLRDEIRGLKNEK